MKISKLHIDQFRHLENLTFDFTYQSGERKGQPLDKICFIGQSATGKTSLLELINDNIKNFHKTELDEEGKIWSKFVSFNGNVKIHKENDVYEYINGVFIKNNYPFQNSEKSAAWTSYLFDETDKIFYFTSELLSNKNIKLFEEDTVLLIEKFKTSTKNELDINKQTFDEDIDEAIWIRLLKNNLEYLQNFLQFATELINSGSVLDNSSQKKVDSWKLKNNNPLLDFSEKFNIILDKIQLEIDLINTKNIIPLRHKITGENIPIKNISTGTKHLLLTALPLYNLDTRESIILIDEPERSLYPDMQMDLMEYYQNLARNAQFIVATHSPFIAASFEPDERFILYFDEEGKVAVRRGESPIGDDPNDILKNDFGLEFLMNKKGIKAFERYRNLKNLLASEKNEEAKDKLLEEILMLANAYKF